VLPFVTEGRGHHDAPSTPAGICAGLVYKHFGKEVLSGIMDVPESDESVHAAWLAVYRSFIEAVDAVDNGVSQYDTDGPPRWVGVGVYMHTCMCVCVCVLNLRQNVCVCVLMCDREVQPA
jgi:Uncharacterised protein family (UPF0160)